MAAPNRFGPISFIGGENKGKYPFCNSVYVEGARVLIDPGSDRRALEQLRADKAVDEVWLTHFHEDHITHLDLFDDVPLVMPEPEAGTLASADAFMDAYGIDEVDLREVFRVMLAQIFHFRPRRPSRLFRGGEVIERDGVKVEVLHTPGHTAGHCAFWFEQQGVLVLGDYDLTDFGPWYGDVGSSIEQTVSSVRTLQAIDAPICLAAHLDGVFEQPAAALWDAFVDVIEQREQRYLEQLATPKTMDDIVAAWVVYKKPREPLAFFRWGERAMAKKHLERLVAAGKVERRGERYVVAGN